LGIAGIGRWDWIVKCVAMVMHNISISELDLRWWKASFLRNFLSFDDETHLAAAFGESSDWNVRVQLHFSMYQKKFSRGSYRSWLYSCSFYWRFMCAYGNPRSNRNQGLYCGL